MPSTAHKSLDPDIDHAEIETLLKQRELLDATEEIAQMGHCQWDFNDNRLISCSQGYARIFNMSIAEITELQSDWEQSLAQIHPDDRVHFLKAYHSQQQTGNYTVEYRFMRNDGQIRGLREAGMLQFDESGNFREAFGIIQDITEKKNYEQNMLDAQDSLEAIVAKRTQQLADTVTQLKLEMAEREIMASELERFAYTASHDLKTPLVTIKGFLGLLNKDLAARDMGSAAKDIERVNHAADTMATLLEDLLELSRIGRVMGEAVPCNLAEIARHALQMVETRIIELGAEIEVEDMPVVKGDRVRLIEVYQNLIENAIKFMGNQKSPRVHIGSESRNGVICYFVRDNGSGISAEYQGLVFELFERLNTEIEGTGVGLTLVKRIIEVHGGKIWIESEGPGEGSVILFTIPESTQSALSSYTA